MALPSIQPANLSVPHLGEIKATRLTIGLVKWIDKAQSQDSYDFLKRYLTEHTTHQDGDEITVNHLSNGQLDEIAPYLAPILCDFRLESENSEEDLEDKVTNAAQLEECVQARIDEFEQSAAKMMKRVVKPLKGMTSVSKSLDRALNPPGMKSLMDMMNSPSLKLLQDAMKPTYLDQITQFHKTQNLIGSSISPTFPSITIGEDMARLAGIMAPRDDIFKTVEMITKQMSFLSPEVSALMKATYPNFPNTEYFLQGLKKPGFEVTAQAGLSGLASKALSAEILKQYYTFEDNDAAGFKATLETIKSLDDIDKKNPELLTDLGRSAPQRMSQIDNIHIGLLLQFITMVIAAISLYTVMTDNGDELVAQGLQDLQVIYAQSYQQIQRQENRYRFDRVLTSRYHLRESPNKKAISITILNADRIVRVVKTDGNWAYVIVYPYGSEPELEGWVYRYGLKPLL